MQTVTSSSIMLMHINVQIKADDVYDTYYLWTNSRICSTCTSDIDDNVLSIRLFVWRVSLCVEPVLFYNGKITHVHGSLTWYLI